MENPLILIVDSYNESHRYYHTLSHLTRMFSYAKENNIPLNRKQKLAIWYHDICYNVKGMSSKKNEEVSAELAYIHTYKELGKDGSEDVKRIILDTIDHIPHIEESKVVIDLDLIDLAFKDRFYANEDNIRKEYSHLNDEEYKQNKIKWTEKFLNRKSIFVSKYCIDLDPIAKQILRDHLGELKK